MNCYVFFTEKLLKNFDAYYLIIKNWVLKGIKL